MNTKIYTGTIRKDDYRENCDVLFIGEYKEPIAKIFAEDFQGQKVSIRYWTSDKEKSKKELQKGFLKTLFGEIEAEYEDFYSEYTGYLWTDEELCIGGHDLLAEIRNYEGKYIRLEVDIQYFKHNVECKKRFNDF